MEGTVSGSLLWSGSKMRGCKRIPNSSKEPGTEVTEGAGKENVLFFVVAEYYRLDSVWFVVHVWCGIWCVMWVGVVCYGV